MENVNGKEEKGVLTIDLIGHIDSTNAPKVEEDINALLENYKGKDLIINAEKLEYISSAGLRVILRLSKTYPELVIKNVSSSVYEVLEMTGFSELMHIEKAFRVISVEGCEVIGQGANGKVYRLDPDTIIKVYNNADALPEINRERELARKAFVLGIPTAIPYDVVKVGKGYGSVFELLNAKSFTKLLNADPKNIDKHIKLYVDLLKKIHSTKVKPGDMPNQKEVAIEWVKYLKDYLPKDQYDKALALFTAVPDRDTMIHGDYHTKNIMMQNDEVLLIDMDTLAMGHPIFEISSMYLAFEGFGVVDKNNVEKFLGIKADVAEYFFINAMKQYLNTADDKVVNEVLDKAKVVANIRLMRRTIKRIGIDTPEGKPIVEYCKKALSDLLPRIDSLDFKQIN